MSQISIGVAFIAGVLSFLSPLCIAFNSGVHFISVRALLKWCAPLENCTTKITNIVASNLS